MFDHLASTTISVLLYLGLGAILLLANVWYVRSLIKALRPEEASLIIAPFQVVGKDDPDQKLGLALANMLQARLAKLGREMRASTETLGRADRQAFPEENEEQVRLATVDVEESSDAPEAIGLAEVFAPVPVEIEVGGVQLGGIVASIQRHLVRDRLLRIAVTYTDTKAVVTGFLDLERRKPIWVPTTIDNEDVINAIAYSMVKEAFTRKNPEVEAFTLAEFSTLIELLQEIATLNQRVSAGRSSQEDFAEIQPRIEKLAKLHVRWGPLKRIAAEVAENAGDREKAVAFYLDALRVTRARLFPPGGESSSQSPLPPEEKKILEARLRDLAAQIERLQARTVAARPPTPEPRDGRWILGMLGIGDDAMRGRPTVAILGGLPTESILGRADVRNVSGSQTPDVAAQNEALSTYLDSMIRAVHLAAPRAEILVSPIASMDVASMRAGADALLAANPEVLLVPVTSDGPDFVEFLESLATSQTPVVHSLATRLVDPVLQARYADLRRQLIMVAPADLNGAAAAFAGYQAEALGDGYFWAPGQGIPVGSESFGRDMSGSGPASALAAGLVARILDLAPQTKKGDLLAALRQGSRVGATDGVPLLNLQGALEELDIDPGS